MQQSMLVLTSLLVLFLANCTSNIPHRAPTTLPVVTTGGPAIELASYPCPETPPAWASESPAICGTHPHSDSPLPKGIENGDIVVSGNLFWFIWENTKSRVWFPNDASVFDLTEGQDITGQLIGKIVSAPKNDNWEIMYSVNPQTQQTDHVFLADQKRKIKLGIKVMNLPWNIVKAIPTTIREGYRPVPKEK